MTAIGEGKSPEIRNVRECDCPEWVQRCAHFSDGRRLLLANALHKSGEYCLDNHPRFRYSVYSIDGNWHSCACGCGIKRIWNPQRVQHFGVTNSEADALAVFYAAEEALLAGGDA